jgi:hypothetical protein
MPSTDRTPSVARTYSSVQNVVVTWTARIAHRPAHFTGGWWGVADALGHKLHLPRKIGGTRGWPRSR